MKAARNTAGPAPARSHRVHRTAENFAVVGRLKLCWDSFGDPGDPAVILVMGMAAQMIGWDDEFCEQLALKGFRVIRFDNRDVGRSTWLDHLGVPNMTAAMTRAFWRLPVSAPYLLNDMADDLVGLMDALGIEAAHVVGASMGGTIAQALAIRQPERMLSMTSIMSTTGNPDLPKPKTSAMAAVMRPLPRIRDRYVEQYADTYQILRGGRFPEEQARDRARAARNHARGINPAGGARHMLAILASGSRKQALRKVEVPTVVIHGDIDPLVPLAAGVDTAQSIPGAELRVVRGMGHALPMAVWPHIIDGILSAAGQLA